MATLGYSAAEMKALRIACEVHSGYVFPGYNVTSNGCRHRIAHQTLTSLCRLGAMRFEEFVDCERGGKRLRYAITEAGRNALK